MTTNLGYTSYPHCQNRTNDQAGKKEREYTYSTTVFCMNIKMRYTCYPMSALYKPSVLEQTYSRLNSRLSSHMLGVMNVWKKSLLKCIEIDGRLHCLSKVPTRHFSNKASAFTQAWYLLNKDVQSFPTAFISISTPPG